MVAILFGDIWRDAPIGGVTVDSVVERIIDIESDRDPNKRSKYSRATVGWHSDL